ATDAPRPKLEPPPPPLVPGSAFAVLSFVVAAVSVTSLVCAASDAAAALDAVVVPFERTSANEPATPTDPPPAPLVPCAAVELWCVALPLKPCASARPE